MTSPNPPATEHSIDRWEDEGGPPRSRGLESSADLDMQLKTYGITPVQLTVFDWGGYRYSNAKDAIAAAQRLRV